MTELLYRYASCGDAPLPGGRTCANVVSQVIVFVALGFIVLFLRLLAGGGAK
jgi:hypothetical protein